MTEKWAQDCAKYEQGGASEYLKAALQYEKQVVTEGWSGDTIAAEVSGAGFYIHGRTVRRRLEALRIVRDDGHTRPNSKAFLEAFAEAYASLNTAARGGQTPLDPETARRVYLEGVVGEFDRLFKESVELDEDELASIRLLRDKCDAVLSGRRLMAV